MAKYASRRSNIRLWILLVAVILAIVLAVIGIVKLFKGTEPSPKPDDNPGQSTDDPNNPSTDDPSNPDNPGTQDPVTPDDPKPGSEAAALAQADKLAKGYFYDEAIAMLSSYSSSEAKAKVDEYTKLKNGLVKYTGQVFHVFFHSLILDTDLAFDNKGSPAANYNDVMTTRSEFNKMLPLFLENDFILYDITELCEMKNGKLVKKDIYLPAGKKPLIISIDDVNYYTYMVQDGFARYLDVDENGRVVTMVGGTPILRNDAKRHVMGYKDCEASYDGDVMPILDTFVMEHPEFSYRGAKGVVAITGYEGAFGYRITDLDWYTKEEQEQMLNKVREVAQALRNTGWQIANHSYTHNQYWTNKTMTMDQLKYDTGRWMNEIMPYVGETHILISPFGAYYGQNDERTRYIIEECGFYIYCPVGSAMVTQYYSDNMIQERLNLDGTTMIKYPERVKKYFFDPALVLDPARPAMK